MTKNSAGQIDKFKSAAKEAGAEISEAEFRRTVGKVAKAPKPKNGPLKEAKEKPSGG